jgi:biotin carboxyl carrier protein
MMVFEVEMPEAAGRRKTRRMASATAVGEVGATVRGTVWRIGDRQRTLAVGDFVREGQEVANLEVMKTENMVLSPVTGTVVEIVAEKNSALEAGQLILVIEPGQAPDITPASDPREV